MVSSLLRRLYYQVFALLCYTCKAENVDMFGIEEMTYAGSTWNWQFGHNETEASIVIRILSYLVG